MKLSLAGIIGDLSGAVTTLLKESGIDPATKNQHIAAVTNNAAALAANPSAIPVAPPAAQSTLQSDISQGVTDIENLGGTAVETIADDEIRSVTGPFSPAAIAVANHLLSTLGGDLKSAIAHLLAAGGIQATPNSPVNVTVTAQTGG
jgi:hypothetical protein